jgi:hypothetical protein
MTDFTERAAGLMGTGLVSLLLSNGAAGWGHCNGWASTAP